MNTYNPFREKVILCIALTALVVSLVLTLSFLKYQRDMRELNRLQGVFNDKTIEFFKMINENESRR